MQQTIFKFIIAYSKKQQLMLLFLILVSMPFLYAVLEMPKEIINDAIDGEKFPVTILGSGFDQIEYLLLLCGSFLGLVLINGGFKYWVSVYKGALGERMLRRLRYQLGSQVMRFPLPHFRKMSQGEIITMVTAEVEPLGGYVGDALAVPALEGGRMLTILVFMFMQDPYLGMAAVALYPLQVYLIPKLQKQVNELSKRRVLAVRKLSERMGETISGIKEIHAHDTSEYERAGLSQHLGGIYAIRFDIYRKKFLIKFLNNFLAQMTPFFFYSIGGYLVIEGSLSFGALVAVLAAYKDLSSPWNDLLTYYQGMENAKIKYQQLVDQFRPSGMLDEALQGDAPKAVETLDKPITASFLRLEEESGATVLDGATFQIDFGEKVCILGPEGGGRSELSQIVARLLRPDGGAAKIGDDNIAKLHEAVTGRRMAYVGENAALFSGTVRDNLSYGLKHEPLRPAAYDADELKAHQHQMCLAREAGNAAHDMSADWIDYAAAGVSGPEQFSMRVHDVLDLVDLKDELYEFGLKQRLDPNLNPDVAARLLQARAHLHHHMEENSTDHPFEPFNRKLYNSNLSVAENLLFGTPLTEDLATSKLSENPYVIEVLHKVGLYDKFVDMGAKLADMMVDMFRDIPPDHEYFRRFSFIQADELPEFVHCVRCIEADGIDSLSEMDRRMLISLPFNLVVARHRLQLIDEGIQNDLLRAREVFASELPKHLHGTISFFDEGEYNPSASIQDNLLFGKLVFGKPEANQHLCKMIAHTVERFGLRFDIIEAGLETEVGIGGSRLSSVQRQKIAIARAMLKRADLLIVDSATSVLASDQEATLLDNILKDCGVRGLLWVLNRPDLTSKFEKALVMKGGQVVEQCKIEEIAQSESTKRNMVMAGVA